MDFRNILFPVDFSESCDAAAPHVRAACERFHSSLLLAHFIDIPMVAYGPFDAPIPVTLPIRELTDIARERLRVFAARFFAGVNPQMAVCDGDPALRILDQARASKIDLIMMPTHGKGRFRALLLGSVTAKILHDAECAVWTSSHSDKPPVNTGWNRILCAVDTDAEGTRLIRKAAELTADGKRKACLVHAVAPGMAPGDPFAGTEFTDFLMGAAKNTLIRMQAEASTDFGSRVRAGTVIEVVREAAVECKADLVLMGRGVMPRFAGQIRSHAYSIVRSMPCPVLSV